MDIIGVQREAGKPPMVLMAVSRRTSQRLWDRVQGKIGGPAPKGLKSDKVESLKPGLVGRVRFLKGEEKLRHAKLLDYRAK
jgi:hypothetical protein